MDKTQELIARTEIEDCLKRYARGIDRKDWALVKSGFHSDAIDAHGEFLGGPDEFIDWVKNRHQHVPFSMHFLGQSLIEFESEKAAISETYFWAIQRRDAPDGADVDLEVFGRYVDRFEKRDDTWRVARREVVYDSTRTQPSTHSKRLLAGKLGRRDKGDPIYLAREVLAS